jgi:RHS repeat-associated protein
MQATETNEFLFSGKRLLPVSGKYDFLFRNYDPATGRFIQRDPAGTTDGLNLYTYVGNNPLSYADPAGLERKELWLGKEIGADFTSPDINMHDPNLGRDDLSTYYFDEHGTFLRWNERTSSWVEDFTGVNIIIENAPEPKRSWLERYVNGVRRGVMAPAHLLKDTGAKVVDMGTQGWAVLGKVTGGWDTGYTTWSSTSKAVEAGVSQKELLWQATGGLVVNPIIGVGDLIFKQDPEALGEMVGGAMVGGVYKGFKDSGVVRGNRTTGGGISVIPKGKKFYYQIDGTVLNVKSKITRVAEEVSLYEKSLRTGWEYLSYRGAGNRRRIKTDYKSEWVSSPRGAKDVLHTHTDIVQHGRVVEPGIALPSKRDMDALRGTVEAVLGRAFPEADALLRDWGLPETGLVMKTTYSIR